MGSQKNFNFHPMNHFLHYQGHSKQQKATCVPPKGWLAIKVGEEQERVVVPVMYLKHPRFVELLKEAEEEYGFHHNGGTITIPCRLDQFRYVQSLIDRELQSLHHHHHNHLLACFKPTLSSH